MNPLISIIIPVYNVEKYLSKCVDSVLEQTYTNLEIILINDGSTDKSGEICDDYAKKDKRIQVIHQKNRGLSAARNIGLTRAHGEFISFIDSDDWCDSKFIEYLLKTIKTTKTQIACAGYYAVFPSSTQTIKILSTDCFPTVISSITAMEKGFDKLGFYAWNKLFKRVLFDKITFPEGLLFEDMVTIPQVLNKTDKVGICDLPLYYYNRSNLNSITKSKFSIKKLDYFDSSQRLLEYAINIQQIKLIYLIKQTRAYMISGFFRQMAIAKFNDKDIIIPLQKELRRNIGKLLISHHKLSNKFFAIACCISFNLTTKFYRFFFVH